MTATNTLEPTRTDRYRQIVAQFVSTVLQRLEVIFRHQRRISVRPAYLARLDSADAEEPAVAEAKSERLHEKIAALKEQMQALKRVREDRLAAAVRRAATSWASPAAFSSHREAFLLGLGRLLSFACPDSTGRLRGIPAAQPSERGRSAWITEKLDPTLKGLANRLPSTG